MYAELDLSPAIESRPEATSKPQMIIAPTVAAAQSIEALDLLQAMEAQVTEAIKMELKLIEQLHPEWYQMYDECPPETSTAAELRDLMAAAPNSFAKGLIAGAMKVRLEIAAITGRMF